MYTPTLLFLFQQVEFLLFEDYNFVYDNEQ